MLTHHRPCRQNRYPSAKAGASHTTNHLALHYTQPILKTLPFWGPNKQLRVCHNAW